MQLIIIWGNHMSNNIVRFNNNVLKFPTLWTPASISTLAWYDASDLSTITESGGAVSQWEDKSGNGNNAEQLTGSEQPISGVRSINSLNVLDFNSSNSQNLVMDNGVDLIDKMFFIVVEKDVSALAMLFGNTVNNTQLRIKGADQSLEYASADPYWIALAKTTTTLTNSVPVIGCFIGDTSLKFTINGFLEDSGTGNDGSGLTTYNQIGNCISAAPFDGKIGEIIMVSTIDTVIRQKIEGYLSWKWGLESELPYGHPYKNGAPLNNGSVVSPPNWTPEMLTTTAWYDASDLSTITESGSSVSQWDDKSGNARHITQTFGSDQPTTGIRAIGELNAIDFDGVGDFLIKADADVANIFPDGKKIFVFTIADLEIGSDAAMLAYFSNSGGITGTSEYNGFGGSGSILEAHMGLNSGKTDPFIMNEDGAARAIATGSLLDQNPHMLMGVFDRTASTIGAEIWLDGTLEATDTDSPKSSLTCDTFIMGRSAFGVSDRRTDGGVGEVIIVHDIDESPRQKIEGYFAWKWGLVANLPVDHPYKNSAPKA
jgi:hypothetical protein